MKIGFIGAGKAGVSLAKYFSQNNLNVVGFYSRNKNSAQEAALFIGANHFDTIEEIIQESNIIFIAVSDTAIPEVWGTIKKLPINNKIICHLSGAMSSHVFEGIEELNAVGYSLHPFISISDKLTSYKKLNGACFTLEGSKKEINTIKDLIEGLGNKVYIINAQNKALYHCAAVFASNFMVALAQISTNLLKDCGFNEADTNIVFPLMEASINNIASQGITKALTGPVERCDIETVNKHLKSLSGNQKEIYVQLSNILVDIAKVKNKDTNYKNLENILKGACTNEKHG